MVRLNTFFAHLLYRSFSCDGKTCGDKTGSGGGAVTCTSFQAPNYLEKTCFACVDGGSECCLDTTCGVPWDSRERGALCGPGFINKDENTPCSDCSDDGADCCTAKTCATGKTTGAGVSAVTCGNYFVTKPGTTLCTDCFEDDTECCALKTCSDKTGSGGGAVTCGSNFIYKSASQEHTGSQWNTSDDTSGTTGTCWQAYLPNYPNCSGYASAGYTCVGKYCAAVNPGGTPSRCAIQQPPGYNVDDHTGKCTDPLACSTCANDGDECCTPIRNCAYTWNPWSTCQPGATYVLVPGDGNKIENEQQCTDACQQAVMQGPPCSSVWTDATASSSEQCEITLGATQERGPSITIQPQGGGTKCPEDEGRSCKLDVSVNLFFFEVIPLSYS